MIQRLEALWQEKMRLLHAEKDTAKTALERIEKQLLYYENLEIILKYPYVIKRELSKSEVLKILGSLGIMDPFEQRSAYQELMQSVEAYRPYSEKYTKWVDYLEQEKTVPLKRTQYQIIAQIQKILEADFYHDENYYYIGTTKVQKDLCRKRLETLLTYPDIKGDDLIPLIVVACTYDLVLDKEQMTSMERNMESILSRRNQE